MLEKGLFKVELNDLNAGMLFEFDGTIALKTEYRNDIGACMCYIVGTGEMFWAGTKTAKDLNNLMVMPVWIKEK